MNEVVKPLINSSEPRGGDCVAILRFTFLCYRWSFEHPTDDALYADGTTDYISPLEDWKISTTLWWNGPQHIAFKRKLGLRDKVVALLRSNSNTLIHSDCSDSEPITVL